MLVSGVGTQLVALGNTVHQALGTRQARGPWSQGAYRLAGKKTDSGHYKQNDYDEREAWVGDLWFNWLVVRGRGAVRAENRASCVGEDKETTPLNRPTK